MINDFIKNRHSNFNMPENIVTELVYKATGKKTEFVHKIVRGYDNEVYSIAITDGKQFIVRIKRGGEVSFLDEEWAMKECRKIGIPIPEVYVVETINYEDAKIEVMVEEKLAGKPIIDIWDILSTEDKDTVLRKSGEVLSKIHEIKVNGFWRRQSDGKWDFDNWEALSLSNIKNRTSEESYILGCGFDKKDFIFMIDMLKLLKDKYSCNSPVLCHGDYIFEHIFIDENLNISGIIDFGEMCGGTEFDDLTYFSFEHPNENFDMFLKGYFNTNVIPVDFSIQLYLHKLSKQMGYLAHFVKIADAQSVKYAAKELHKTINILIHNYA